MPETKLTAEKLDRSFDFILQTLMAGARSFF